MADPEDEGGGLLAGRGPLGTAEPPAGTFVALPGAKVPPPTAVELLLAAAAGSVGAAVAMPTAGGLLGAAVAPLDGTEPLG